MMGIHAPFLKNFFDVQLASKTRCATQCKRYFALLLTLNGRRLLAMGCTALQGRYSREIWKPEYCWPIEPCCAYIHDFAYISIWAGEMARMSINKWNYEETRSSRF